MAAKKQDEDKPLIVKQGSVVVKIYATERIRNGREFTEFTVVWYELDGKRCRKVCATLEKAKEKADELVRRLSRGVAATGVLAGADLEKYRHAVALFDSIGVSLLVGAEDYVEARKALPPGASLRQAVSEYASRHADVPRRTVKEAVREFLEEKSKSGLSAVHLKDLRKRLTTFADAIDSGLPNLTAGIVREFLVGMKKLNDQDVAPRTRVNFHRCICTLLHFCRRRKYVPRELVDEIAEISLPRPRGGEVGFFTAEQMRTMLAKAVPDIVPCLVLGGFAGLRSAEISRLNWRDVKLKERVIVIGAQTAKTASRRVVPIQDNLAAWLEPVAKKEGRVSPAPTEGALTNRFVRDAGLAAGMNWVRNGLRHSFVSYRLAVTHDPARVATEAGNSPAMVHRHYKALCTEAEGKEWFAIVPPSDSVQPPSGR